MVRNLPVNVETTGDIEFDPWSRRPSGENGNQYSCWENLMDTGAWQATALGVTESQTLLNN